MTRDEITELFKDWKSESHRKGYLSPGHIAIAINPDIEYYSYPLHLNDEKRKDVKNLAASALNETYQKYFEVDETGISNVFLAIMGLNPNRTALI